MEAKLSKLSSDSGRSEGADSELNVVASKYESFLRECNAVDVADICTAVISACADIAELADFIGAASFLIVNPQCHCQLEVPMYIFLFICSQYEQFYVGDRRLWSERL